MSDRLTHPVHPEYGPCNAVVEGECSRCRDVVAALRAENKALRETGSAMEHWVECVWDEQYGSETCGCGGCQMRLMWRAVLDEYPGGG